VKVEPLGLLSMFGVFLLASGIPDNTLQRGWLKI